jgi:copper(I)-binding protein
VSFPNSKASVVWLAGTTAKAYNQDITWLLEAGAPSMTSPARRDSHYILLALTGLSVTLVVVTGCSSSSADHHGATRSPSPNGSSGGIAFGHAEAGELAITDAYIPAQASPAVAAAYLTISDANAAGETLLSASTPAAASVQLYETVNSGSTGTMRPLKSLVISADVTVSLAMGNRHLMLMKPPTMLAPGRRVPLTLRFKNAGTVTFSIPVVAVTGPFRNTTIPSSDMSGMPGMGG